MISDKRERNCIRHTMSERLAERGKKPPLRLLVIRNGMPMRILSVVVLANENMNTSAREIINTVFGGSFAVYAFNGVTA